MSNDYQITWVLAFSTVYTKGEKKPTISNHPSLRTERQSNSPVIAWATTRLKESPLQLHGWDAKNTVNLTGMTRSQSQRVGSVELKKPISVLTSSTVRSPELTRVCNVISPRSTPSGRESRNGDGRQSEVAIQQSGRMKTDYRGTEIFRNRKPSFTMSSFPAANTTGTNTANSQLSPTSVSPRRQDWAFGISVLGRNSQSLMLSTLQILEKKGIEYAYLGPYRLACTHSSQVSPKSVGRDSVNRTINTIKWEMEVVQVPQMKSYGIRFKYISGATLTYQALEQWIINEYPKTTA